MPLLVNNDNDILIANLRDMTRPNVPITNANVKLKILESNELRVTNVAVGATTVVTFATAHGFSPGDRVFCNRFVGPESLNGLHTISTVTTTSITLPVDTSGDPQPWKAPSGAVFRLVLNGGYGGAEEVDFIWDSVISRYVATVLASTDLIPRVQYILFASESSLHFEEEQREVATIRN